MRRLTRVSALLLALALLTGCAAGRAFSSGEDARARGRLGFGRHLLPDGRAGRPGPARIPHRARARDVERVARSTSTTPARWKPRTSSTPRCSNIGRTVEFDPGNTQALDRIVQLEKIIRDRHRGLAAQAGHCPAARAGTPGVAGAAAESRIARAARLQLQAGEPARHPDVHQQRDRHQRHLRRELQRSPRDGDAAGLDRAGAQHAAVVERLVLHRARRAHDRRRAGLGAEPPEVRAAGRAHDSAVVRRRDRAVGDADGDHADDDRRHDSARHHSEQDEQLALRCARRSRWWRSFASWCSPTTSRAPRSRSTSKFSRSAARARKSSG